MRGLTFSSDQSFAAICAPLMPDFARWYWLTDVQSGPFAFSHLPPSTSLRLEDSLNKHHVSVAALTDTSAQLWRAGVFPAFAEYLVEDEWSYLVALDRGFVDVVSTAELLVRARYLSANFFEIVERSAEIFLLEISRGTWEAYSRQTALLDRVRAFAPARVVESGHWSQQ